MNRADSIISVVVVEHVKLFRDCLQIACKDHPDIRILADVQDFEAAVRLVKRHTPDLVLVGGSCLENGAIPFIQTVKDMSPATQVMIVNHLLDDGSLISALEVGCRGYLNKDAGLETLFEAVAAVHRGELWVERRLFATYAEHLKVTRPKREIIATAVAEKLTGREREVYELLSKGYSNKDIAKSLYISEKTIKSHLHHIFRKLHVRNRLEAILSPVEDQQAD